jgi:polyphosphate kinase 2 (PPK2 family)
VVLVIAGTDRLGGADLINLLHEWMDARYIEANIFEKPSEEELEQPRFWRYWRALPAKGRIGIFHREWTTSAIVDRVKGNINDVGLDERLRHIETFEKALVDDGAVVLKFWLHLSEKALARRFEEAQRDKDESWKITKDDRLVLRHYAQVHSIAEQVLRRTSVGRGLWNVVESADWRYRNVAVAQTIIQTLTLRLAEPVLSQNWIGSCRRRNSSPLPFHWFIVTVDYRFFAAFLAIRCRAGAVPSITLLARWGVGLVRTVLLKTALIRPCHPRPVLR